MADTARFRVPWEKTCWSCQVQELNFDCTDDLAPLDRFIGQPRALEALRFGLEVEKPGYNLFVTGLSGTGKASAIKAHLKTLVSELAARRQRRPVYDWCYVHNFDDPDRPDGLRLPHGMGKPFRSRMTDVRHRLRTQLPEVFRGEEYENERRALEEQGRRASQQLMSELEQAAQGADFAIQMSQMGMSIFPMIGNRPMTPEEYQRLAPEQRKAIDEARDKLMRQTEDTMSRIRDIEKDTADKLRTLERVAANQSVIEIFREVTDTFRDLPELLEYVNRVMDYVLDNLHLFREPESAPSPLAALQGAGGAAPASSLARNSFLPFEINVLVDNSEVDTVPIVLEPHPNWGNLFGRIERRAMFGTYISDHTMLKPGSMHQANGGYLVLNARDLLMYPMVWENLKRVLRNREIRLEDPAEQTGFFIPQGLRPEPIPLSVKVIVTGDETIYRLLTALDNEDFWDLFKVKAEFDYRVEQTPENIQGYCAFICRTCSEEGLLAFDVSAAIKVLEFAARLVSDRTKLSTRFGQIKDLLIESDYWARKAGAQRVMGEHVRQAIDHKYYRLNLIEERLRELIAEGSVLIDVDKSVAGQINGLAVYDLGDFMFGRPSRITAQTFAGRGNVINIERESLLSGRIHDKGVLILSGFLGARYGQWQPLALSVSLCFEQSYEGVDGDSASSTELYAILSSLSGLPLRQDIAVTGSVNQKGEVQPIGGVNQKIEGMFDVCRALGLTGRQGVMIPARNSRNLVLREDVVEAIKAGQFHVYAVNTIDEGIEVLTGTPAGERQADGRYPEGTVNHLVEKRLQELAQTMRSFMVAGQFDGNRQEQGAIV